MSITRSRGSNAPRICGVYCQWREDRATGNWQLRRLDTNEVVGEVINLHKRRSFRGSVGEMIVAMDVPYLGCAKNPVVNELDKRWSKLAKSNG